MATDPRYASAPQRPDEPSVYEDPGFGANAALDAFTGDLGDEPPVDPTALLAHDVTAVLVAHNGQRWLPRTLEALTALDRRPDRIIAVDTGSRDDTSDLLTATLGAPAVVSAPASTGFGAAVALGIETADEAARIATSFARPGVEPVRWVWLLHDDSAPDPDALRRLLEAAVRRPEAGVIGPKVLGWRDDRQLLEVGISISGGGRRHTGLDKREYDQGQHDDVREVLAVGSAGMLVRRDVWDELGGFDPLLSIFRDDVDFGWRVNQAGYTVMVCAEAVVHHAEAAAHGRRRLGATRDRPHLADRRNAVYVLLANASAASFLFVLLRVLVGGLGRAVGFLFGKQPALAAEELLAVVSVIGRPDHLIRARVQRRRTRSRAQAELRPLFPPPAQQLRHAAENILGVVSGSSSGHDIPGSSRRATTGDEDDDIPDNDDAFLLRLILHPSVLLVAGLTVATLLAVRALIGAGRLTGGALLPAPGGAGELWQTYTEAWHGVGLGSPTASPPYLAVVSLVSSLVRNASLAVDLLLLASVPLAGITAYLLLRRLVTTPLLRVWAAATYALLPATTGAIAAGRLGTAVAAVLTPLVVLAIMRTLGTPGQPGPFRAAWSAGLMLAVTAAFVPLAWVLALLLGAVALLTIYRDRATARRIGAVLVVMPIVLIPWTGTLLRTPMLWVTEAGAPGPGLSDPSLAPWAILLQHPGGPGAAPVWIGIGVVLAGWAALLRRDRRRAILTAWVVAGTALFAGVVLSRLPVTGPTLETPVAGWPGYPTVLVGGALLVAAVLGAEGARQRMSSANFGWRQPLAAVLLVAAVATPLAGAGWWVWRGADDPISRRDPSILPAYVADEAERPDRIRTLVLSRADDGRVTYALLRSSGPRLGDAETGPPPEKYAPLDAVVADLVSGRGSADGARLAEFAAKYVYLPKPFNPDLADTLDTVPGLVRASAPEGAAMWRIDQPVARVWVSAPGPDGEPSVPTAGDDGDPVVVPSDEVDATGSVPEGAEGRTLVVSELADPGWSAVLDGEELEPTTFDDWAQAFEVGATGGQVEVTHQGDRRAVWLWLQLVAVVVAVVLAMPGMRRERGAVDDAADIDPDEPTSPELPVVPAPVGPVGRRAVETTPDPGLPVRVDSAEAPAWSGPRPSQPSQPLQPRPAPRPGGRRRRRAGSGSPAPTPEPTLDPTPTTDRPPAYEQQPTFDQPTTHDQPASTDQPSADTPAAGDPTATDATATDGRGGNRYRGRRAKGRRAKGRRDDGGQQ